MRQRASCNSLVDLKFNFIYSNVCFEKQGKIKEELKLVEQSKTKIAIELGELKAEMAVVFVRLDNEMDREKDLLQLAKDETWKDEIMSKIKALMKERNEARSELEVYLQRLGSMGKTSQRTFLSYKTNN